MATVIHIYDVLRGPSVERLKHAAGLRASGDSWLISFVIVFRHRDANPGRSGESRVS